MVPQRAPGAPQGMGITIVLVRVYYSSQCVEHFRLYTKTPATSCRGHRGNALDKFNGTIFEIVYPAQHPTRMTFDLLDFQG